MPTYYMGRYGQVRRNKLNQDDVPVVVISPEDREQVERLWRAHQGAGLTAAEVTAAIREGRTADIPGAIDKMQAALREFANPTPPKPPEPTGLGLYREGVAREDRTYFAHTPNGWWVLGGQQQVAYSWEQICEDYDAATIEPVQS